MRLVDRKVEAGDTEAVAPLEPEEEESKGGAKIIDLTELLQRSLRKGTKAASDAEPKADAKAKAKPRAAPAKRAKASKSAAAPAKTASRRRAA